MQLSPHFSLAELTRSETAQRWQIRNIPDVTGIARLTDVCENVLEPVRARWGMTMVNSGYRSAAVNAKVPGSSDTSQHTLCEAADFEVPGVPNAEIAKWIAAGGLPHGFDQLILEFYVPGDPSSGWVHGSWTRRQARGEILTAVRRMVGGKLKTVYLPGLVL